MNQELKRIKLADIVPSATNPRKNFKTPDWADFVESVRTHGVIQPGVCRPNKGKYELVAGERRYRASVEAKLPDMPLVVRELTDAQVVEIQQIENLQREDLSALEEAQGYADWRDSLIKGGTVKTVEEAVAHICGKINRKRSAVFGRLALLKVAPAVKKALQEGKLYATKAQLISQIPDPKDQAECLEEAVDGWDAPMSFRDLQNYIEEQYRVKLKDATFSTGKAYAIPTPKLESPATYNEGPCAKCLFNTSNMGDKFPDAAKTPNICTNPACFKAKTVAHTTATLAEASKAGKPVISAESYKKQRYSLTKADDTCYSTGSNGKSYSTLAKVAGIQPKIAVNDEGEIQEVFTREDIGEIKKANKIKEHSYSGGSGGDESRKRSKLKKENSKVAYGATSQILKKFVTTKGIDERLWRLLADGLCDLLDIDREAQVSYRLGIATKMTEVRDALEKYLTQKLTTQQLQEFVVEALLCASWDEYSGKFATEYKGLCKLAGGSPEELAKREDVIKIEKALDSHNAINDSLKKSADAARKTGSAPKFKMSAAAKARISAQAKARWARVKANAEKKGGKS